MIDLNKKLSQSWKTVTMKAIIKKVTKFKPKIHANT